MKKLISIILSTLFILIFSTNQTNALSIADYTPSLDQKVAKMKTTEEKVQFLQSFSDLLATPKFTKDKNARLFADLRQYTLNMLNVFQHELRQEQATKASKTSTKTNTTSTTKTTTSSNKSSTRLPHLYDNFSNIDEQKVRNAILSWHNDERENV
jgi:hypothetical protein